MEIKGRNGTLLKCGILNLCLFISIKNIKTLGPDGSTIRFLQGTVNLGQYNRGHGQGTMLATLFND